MNSTYASHAQLQRQARRLPGRVPLRAPDLTDADVAALPSVLARVGRLTDRRDGLPAPRTDVACAVYEPDAGRIKLTAAIAAFGWARGIALDVRRDGDRIVIVEPPSDGPPRGTVKRIVEGGRLSIPAGMRRQSGLEGSPTWAVFTDLTARRVVVTDLRRLAALTLDGEG